MNGGDERKQIILRAAPPGPAAPPRLHAGRPLRAPPAPALSRGVATLSLTLREAGAYDAASFRAHAPRWSHAPPLRTLTRPLPEIATMEATKTKLVDYRVKNGVAWLELTDPPANTYTYEMMRDLDEAILTARFDEAVHVLVLRGAGEKCFCAGANINMLKTVNPTFKYFFCLPANETLNRLEHTPKLVIAALNGHTVGGGLEIAMAADLRIARKGAGKIGLPEVTLGVLPGTGGTQRLARLVNKSTAIELMVTGETFDFDRGLQLGIVNQIWEAASNDEFLDKIQK